MGKCGGKWLKRMPNAQDFAMKKNSGKSQIIKNYKSDNSIKDNLADNLSLTLKVVA